MKTQVRSCRNDYRFGVAGKQMECLEHSIGPHENRERDSCEWTFIQEGTTIITQQKKHYGAHRRCEHVEFP